MNDLLPLVLSFIAGLVLGSFYFGGLWWTLRRMPAARHPASLMMASLFVRTALVLAGFYLVAGGEWQRLLAAVLGFFLMRIFLVARLGPRREAAAAKPED